MNKVRVSYSVEEFRAGVIKLVIPAPGEGSQIAVFGIARVSSIEDLTFLSSNRVYANWSPFYNGNCPYFIAMPQSSVTRFVGIVSLQGNVSNYNEFGQQVSKDNCPFYLVPPPSVTGGAGNYYFDIYYDIVSSS